MGHSIVQTRAFRRHTTLSAPADQAQQIGYRHDTNQFAGASDGQTADAAILHQIGRAPDRFVLID